MGMCASQGRLLTLTSLKSDCELMAQKINNDRETLSRQEEKLMTEYTDKTNNKQLLIRKNTDDKLEEVNLTYDELKKAGYTIKVKNDSGKWVAPEKDELKKLKKSGHGERDDSLQFGIMNGTIRLYKGGKQVDYAGESNILEEFDESDDAAAKAKYDLEMKKVHRKDKKLELELDQIETRHKAYETEIDSVQKVINANIETSFKTFNQG